MKLFTEAKLHSVLRVTAVLSLMAVSIFVYASPEGNPGLGFPQFRAAATGLSQRTHLWPILVYWASLFRVIAPTVWLVGILFTLKQKRPLKPYIEDGPFVLVAIVLPELQASCAMAHSDLNRVVYYSLAWAVTASLWSLQTVIRNSRLGRRD